MAGVSRSSLGLWVLLPPLPTPDPDFLLSLATSRLSPFFSPRLNRECEAALLPNLAFELK